MGPIDPQLRTAPPPIPGATIPARSFIDGLEIIRKKIKDENDPVQMYYSMMAQIRPDILVRCQRAIEGAGEFAEKWLKKYMLKDNQNQAELVAEWLSTGEKYKSHGKMIDFEEAKNVLKLNVEEIDRGLTKRLEIFPEKRFDVQLLQFVLVFLWCKCFHWKHFLANLLWDPNSDLWSDIWELYCRSIQFLQVRQGEGAAKLYESVFSITCGTFQF